MSIHPNTVNVLNYPESLGKQIALKFYNWQKLDKTEEVMIAQSVINLAILIDAEHSAQAAKVELCRQAFDQLFGHCCSNGVFNHRGEPMNCTLLNDAMNLKPDDCLKQVKADSGRAGYLQALEDVESRLDGYYATTEAQDIAAADQYAERVKQGLVK